MYSDGQTICTSGCKEAERLHRLGHEELCYARLTEQIRAAIAHFIPRMNAAGNPGAAYIGQPAVRVKARVFGSGTVTKQYPRGPLGWRVSTVAHEPDEDYPGIVHASIGLDITGQLVDLTTREEDPPPWILEQPSPGPGLIGREFDDYDYRYIAEREIPQSLDDFLIGRTGSGLPEHLTRCYYCGHAGFHKLSYMGTLWSPSWPRTCEDCVDCLSHF
ncbi:MAG TPA: hypothetical protein VHW26_10145 [Solirubrobacteraceae bacterium]|jgi:hypothetical protein|nr:hypothetical protein [Solirubrobacteraceae bacterium]